MAKQTKGGKDPKKKTYTIKDTKGSKAQVDGKSVKDAEKNKGVFKERPAYKGKEVKGKDGSVSGVKKHDGSYIRAVGRVARRKAKKALEYDRKVHKADSISHSNTIKAYKQAKPNKK